jgi:hypothetical protein
MTPFHTRFGELAARETRCIHQILPGGPLPVGQYGFVEFYCEEDNCDCRRVLIQVTTPQSPQTALASINYGWESAEFYTRWMHGDEQAGRDIAGAMLDPLQPQSQYADHLLDVFQTIVRTDPAYVARLARHYELFKRAPGYQPRQAAAGPLPTLLKPYLAAPKIGRNDPCPCGSGRKYKHCCGMP